MVRHFQLSFDGGPTQSAQLMRRLADFRVHLHTDNYFGESEPPDISDSDRLEAMTRGGYVVHDEAESQTHKLSGQGLQLLGQLRKRVSRAPEDFSRARCSKIVDESISQIDGAGCLGPKL